MDEKSEMESTIEERTEIRYPLLKFQNVSVYPSTLLALWRTPQNVITIDCSS